MFSLNSFISIFKDFSRSYLFKATVTKNGANIFGNHHFLVKSTSLPQESITEIAGDLQGNNYKIAGYREFQDFTIEFKSDISDGLRYAFVKWCDEIHNPSTHAHGSPERYFGGVNLSHLNGDGNSILDYELIMAWPKSVSEMALSYEDKNIASFSVVFSYQYHIVTPKTTNNTRLPSKNSFVNQTPTITHPKTEVQSFVKDNMDGVLTNVQNIADPSTGRGLVLDVYVPAIKKAVDVFDDILDNGIAGIDTLYDIKARACRNKGIGLLPVETRIWMNDKVSQKEKILDFLK